VGIAIERGRQPVLLVQTPYQEWEPQLSPDGHWIAYTSQESGAYEIYAQPFSPGTSAGATGRKLISRGGGIHPRWRRDGRALFFAALDSSLMTVDIETRRGFQAATPRRLFNMPGPITQVDWSLTPDGKRFLFLVRPDDPKEPFTVVLNWAAGFRN
jgi:eukaryotic-like serine/threonine-protein kinase